MKKILILIILLLSNFFAYAEKLEINYTPPGVSKSVKYHQKIQKKLLFTKFKIKKNKFKETKNKTITKNIKIKKNPKKKKYTFRIR
jgi:hypothetical protein